ncbi:unnamed protein product [Gongylonema pulchrum]|uniref:Uncharacterized protein n=1 Tax=Gongylonema pulchrum TaxID=637853 RepID=A0A3P7RH89_9BILA|nr:unnamed protein product [Gongylonema pulchrum]
MFVTIAARLRSGIARGLQLCIVRFFRSLTGSRSQSDADEMENSLDDSFEFVAESAVAEVELTRVECKHRLYRSQPFRLSTPLPIESSNNNVVQRASSSLPDRYEEKQDLTSSTVPQVPFVPKAIFTNLNHLNATLGTYEAREKVLESLKQRIPLIEADTGRTPEHESDVND